MSPWKLGKYRDQYACEIRINYLRKNIWWFHRVQLPSCTFIETQGGLLILACFYKRKMFKVATCYCYFASENSMQSLNTHWFTASLHHWAKKNNNILSWQSMFGAKSFRAWVTDHQLCRDGTTGLSFFHRVSMPTNS